MATVPLTQKKVFYTAKTHTTGGRDAGHARSDDGHLDLAFSTPGTHGAGTNPEQVFAAGWSACFESAMTLVAKKQKINLPAEMAIDAEVDLLFTPPNDFSLSARLNVSLPGLDRKVAQSLVDEGERLCPYSKAIRGNVPAVIKLV
jgi:Ohr subfamily peroxiredoxin